MSHWDIPNHKVCNIYCILGSSRKLLMSRGARHWFHDIWSYNAKVIEYWTIFSIIIQLNQNQKVSKIWVHSWYYWADVNGEDLMKCFSWFWDLICMIYWFLNCFCHENSNNFKKSSFERKNQLNNAFTMNFWKKHELNMQLNTISIHIGFRVGPMAQATLVYLWRKVVCFVLFVCHHEINQIEAFQIAFFMSLDSSQQGGVHWVGFMMFGLAVQRFLNIEWFIHWKLN